ncbi:F0F1 ATP synthase subunit epsilon [Glycomyces buryatensis]|uniref:ATP synthase epsilon chain n=1 Tax=Glycomyces buryatensis TaxID=2570927 RepID=A0A4V4HST7_9ACTN|nr:F0F1 ATP synthase subunit epsilon [Glycomyces buryatensis]THV42316.1 F0F1 ATP synthase subunit epsilon [Glycomyces buryatensis]
MAKQLNVEVVAVESKVWSGDASAVYARTTEGELGVLAGHQPMLGELRIDSQVRVQPIEGPELAWNIEGGFLSVTPDGVTILAETAEAVAPTAA